MQNWSKFADVISEADSCVSDNPDGMPFYHLADDGSVKAWLNPTKRANPLHPCNTC